MVTKTIVALLVVANVAYTQCRVTYGYAVEQSLINGPAFDDLIDQILSQVNSQQTSTLSKGDDGTLPSQEVRHGKYAAVVNRNHLKESILKSGAFNAWIQQVWEKIVAQYEALIGRTTPAPQEAHSSTTPTTPEIVIISQAQVTTEAEQDGPLSTTVAEEVVTSLQTTQQPQETSSSTTTPTVDEVTE